MSWLVRTTLYLGISGAIYYLYYRWQFTYTYADYKDYLTSLSSISGMVFTIMGIWIAFLYPNAISRIANPEKLVAKDFTESKSDSKRLESIVGAIMTSAIVAVLASIIMFAKTVLISSNFYAVHELHFRATAISTAVFLTLIQLESVFHVVLSNVMFINDLHFKRQSRQADEEL